MNIFVYGTLKKGFRANFILKDSEYMGSANTKPFYRLFTNGFYPCMKKYDDGKSIKGELYKVSIDTLKSLNTYEGVDEGLFSLSIIELDLNSFTNNEKNVDSHLCLGYLYLGDISLMKEIAYWGDDKTNGHSEN